MALSMYKASAPIFVQFLTAYRGCWTKADAHAEAKKIDPAVLLNARLYPDMFPLARQVREATNHAASACGRVAGVELPTFTNTEASIPELKERIAKTNASGAAMAAQMKQTRKLYVRLYALEGSTRQSRASNAGLADRHLCVHPGTVSLGPVLHSAFPEHAGERSTALQAVGGRAF